MDRELLKEKILSVKDINKDIQIIYDVLDELGVKFRHSNCQKCRRDAYNIALEELGLIADASDESGFDAPDGWVYLKDRDFQWNGHRLNQDTPAWVIRRFMAESRRAGEFYAPVPAEKPSKEERPADKAADNKENTEEIKNEDK